ncbi:hypothetical protein RHMOL_Rhmol06G0267600 [Rhododendron molle]|uniref:Uncharacterized protein n=1 Tax=Rhododendron molle TaxID=49168 RepID=A0ACC0NI72_RHOML|nr:hypothetical protein RHMOL_Rhmol06G0267600 [Rhododendron molle]
MMEMERRMKLGSRGLSALGLGCMSTTTGFCGSGKPKTGMIESSITFLDTSYCYGHHTNEVLRLLHLGRFL